MEKNGARSHIQSTMVAQISASVMFQTRYLTAYQTTKGFQTLFKRAVSRQVKKDFGEYVDSVARGNASRLHHVYEWGRVGDPASRLFKLNTVDQGLRTVAFTMEREFLISRAPVPTQWGSNRYTFKYKADVMEIGRPLTIFPSPGKRLVFQVSSTNSSNVNEAGSTIFMPKGRGVLVMNPGGVGVRGSFGEVYDYFFTSNLVAESVVRSGIKDQVSGKIMKGAQAPAHLRRAKYSFRMDEVSSAVKSALERDFGGRE